MERQLFTFNLKFKFRKKGIIKMIRNILFLIFISTIFIISAVYGQRKVLLEEFTGTW